jgi:RHS repeat-associated protein
MKPFRGLLSHAVIAICLLLVLATTTALGAAAADEQDPARDSDGAPAAETPSAPAEVPALRDRNSRTYRTDGGELIARVFSGPVNYRDGDEWEPINDTLVPAADGAHRNKANQYEATLPKTLGEPVRFEVGSSWIEFALDGAAPDAEGVAKGTTKTYADAFEGVDATYAARPEGLKELLTLAGRDARSAFTYDLRTSSGLRARETRDGGLEFADGDGKVRVAIVAPFMYDAAGATAGGRHAPRLELEGDELTLRADRDWLESDKRAFPVVLDPDVQFPANGYTRFHGANQECHVTGGASADTNFCAATTKSVGWDGTKASRALFKFDVGSTIPRDSQVVDATFGAYATARSTGAAMTFEARPITRSWTTAATWNRYDGTSAWTAAGGDVGGVEGSYTWPAGAAPPNWFAIKGLGGMVRDWVDGTKTNNGLLIKQAGEATNQVFSLQGSSGDGNFWPYLDVRYLPRTGAQQFHTFETEQLSDRMSAQVNVGNGNFLLRATDLQLAGTGLDMTISRTYNSLHSVTEDYGNQWTMDSGRGVYLKFMNSGDRVLRGPSGFYAHFKKQSDGSWKSPPGINAKYEEDGNGYSVDGVGYMAKLTYNESREKLYFDWDGHLARQEDRNGNRLLFNMVDSPPAYRPVASITDTRGRNTTFARDAKGLISQITDPTGRSVSYTNDGSWNLVSYVDANGKTTSYQYVTSGKLELLTRITDPNGNITKVTYDAQNRVSTLQRVEDNATQTGPTKTFNYFTTAGTDCSGVAGFFGRTVVTDARSNTTTYCYDKQLQVLKTVDGRGKARSQSYTSNSDVDTLTSATSQAMKFTYDNQTDNRPTGVEQPAAASGGTGLKTSMTYDNNSANRDQPSYYQPLTQKDTQGNTQSYRYDARGNLDKVTNDLASENNLEIHRDAKGRIDWTKDAKGTQTNLTYGDARGNLTAVDRPAPLGDESMVYDSKDRIDVMTDGRGQTTDYAYDNLDRVTSMTYLGGQTVSFTYDDAGNITSRTDNTGTTTYQYDRLNRLRQENFSGGRTNTYTYDAVGNMKTLTDAGGQTTYNYGPSNLLDSMQSPGDAAAITFGYDDDDRRTATNYPADGTNKTRMSFTYDNPGRVTGIKTEKRDSAGNVLATLTSLSYDYNTIPASCGGTSSAETNLRQKATDQVANRTTSYCYDKLNRLTKATESPGSTYVYDYDGNSNITRRTKDGSATSYGFNAANEMCWSVGNAQASAACSPTPAGATTYNHDAAGNLTSSSGGLALAYNSKEQTTSLTGLSGGTAAAATYAGPNQFERATIGSTTQTTSALGVNVDKTGADSTYYRRDDKGQLVSARRPTGAVHYFAFDSIGSVTALINNSGTKVQSYSYDPYGATSADISGGPANPWRFAGTYQDPTGFYKMGLRYYAPGLMRWTQQDAVEGPSDFGMINRYAYAGANPANSTDPTGDCYGYVPGAGMEWLPEWDNRCSGSAESGAPGLDRLRLFGTGVASMAGGAAIAGACAVATRGIHRVGCAKAGASLWVGGGILIERSLR